MIPDYYEFRNATKILSGTGAIQHVPFELQNLGASRVLVLTNRELRGLGLLGPLEAALADGGIEVGAVYDDVPVDSAIEVVNDVARVYRETGCEGIVALGGGSVLDTAKGAAIVLHTGGSDLAEHMGSEAMVGRIGVPFVAIPTTAGTGSEVTCVAVIKDAQRDVKMAFVSYNLLPDVAVIDARMTAGLPPRITASTAMDALCHAVEGYSCRQHNPLSDAYARSAIGLVREYLPVVLDKPRDSRARVAMGNAALLAGVAFSNSMVGVVHALGHAAGGVAHVAHGDAMAILLPHGMAFNLDVAGERYGDLLLDLAGADAFARTPAPDRPVAAIEAVRSLLASVAEKTGLPTTLSAAGVTEAQLPAIARTALDDGAMAFNPKGATEADLLGILRAAL